jgi:hypothetical protein
MQITLLFGGFHGGETAILAGQPAHCYKKRWGENAKVILSSKKEAWHLRIHWILNRGSDMLFSFDVFSFKNQMEMPRCAFAQSP